MATNVSTTMSRKCTAKTVKLMPVHMRHNILDLAVPSLSSSFIWHVKRLLTATGVSEGARTWLYHFLIAILPRWSSAHVHDTGTRHISGWEALYTPTETWWITHWLGMPPATSSQKPQMILQTAHWCTPLRFFHVLKHIGASLSVAVLYTMKRPWREFSSKDFFSRSHRQWNFTESRAYCGQCTILADLTTHFEPYMLE